MLVLMEMILNLLSFISRDGFGIGIFYCGLDRKIPKSRGSGSGFENLEKIPREKSRKSQNPGDRDRDFKTSKKSRGQNPKDPEIPENRIEI